MTDDPFAPIGSGRAAAAASTSKSAHVPVMPVPEDAPPAPAEHFKLGKPSAKWRYTDAAGGLLGYVYRFDADGDKVFRPLIYARPAASGGKAAWRWESWPPKRPLYGLAGLARRPNARVVITEGEKAADAGAMLLASPVVVTSPNGSKGAGKADWSPLHDRAVTIWPDADTAGLEYANAVARHALAAGASSVAIVSPPDGRRRLAGTQPMHSRRAGAVSAPASWSPRPSRSNFPRRKRRAETGRPRMITTQKAAVGARRSVTSWSG
jgi:putative DNA primase/helicase